MRIHSPIFSPQTGFTLLEAMVAMVIFTVGLLGLAGMQMAGMNNTQSAMQQSIAVHLGYDMADRIRSNPLGVETGAYNDLPIGIPGANPPCNAPCSPTQIAQRDHFQWATDLQNMLPAGVGSVFVLANGAFRIRVFWDEDRSGANLTNCDPLDPNALRCAELVFIP